MFESNLLSQINVQSPLPSFVEVEIIKNVNVSLQKAFQVAHVLLAEKSDLAARVLPWSSEMYYSITALWEYFLLMRVDTAFVELMFGLRRGILDGPTAAAPSLAGTRLTGPASRDGSGRMMGNNGNTSGVMAYLRWLCLGPAPMPTPEERALNYANRSEDHHSRANITGIGYANDNMGSSGASYSDGSSLLGGGGHGNRGRHNNSSSIGSMQKRGGDLVQDCIIGDGQAGLAQSSSGSSGPSAMPHCSDAYSGTATDTLAEMRAEELLSADRSSYGHLRFRPLDARRRYLSVLLLTLQPYVQNYIRQWYQHEMDAAEDAVAYRAAYALRHPRRAALRRVCARYLYPVLHILSHTVELLFQALYLLELTPYHSFLYRLCGIARRRATRKDQLLAMHPQVQRATMYARVLLLLILFGFRLLDFSRNSGGSGGGGGGGVLGETELPIPSAPIWGEDVTVHSPSWSGSAVGGESVRSASAAAAGTAGDDGMRNVTKGAELAKPEAGMCPVCRKPVTNVAVCTVSGIVGCYPCMQAFIREHGYCPVTGKSMGPDQIRRVYET